MTHLPRPTIVEKIDITALNSWMVDHRAGLVDDLVALANIETPSDRVDLLDDAGRYLEQWMSERLGEPQHSQWYRSTEHGPVLVLDYPGVATPRLTALAHFDTVFPAGTLHSWPVRVDGDRVTGPGVFDMKAGLVQLVWALKSLEEHGMVRPDVRVVLNSDEEIGSPFSRPLLEDASTGAAAALVFEGSATRGAIKTARKGVGLFTVTVEGVEAHAGLDPEAGVSAIDEMARIIRQLHEAADLSRGTSINVGLVHGGTRANVMAGSATANLDVRVASTAEQQRVDYLLASLQADNPRARISVAGEWNRPIMTRTDGNARMYELASAVAERLDSTLEEASVGGASDGNFLSALGLPVLDGLGGIGGGAHARHENISISGMVERASIAAGVIAAFGC